MKIVQSQENKWKQRFLFAVLLHALLIPFLFFLLFQTPSGTILDFAPTEIIEEVPPAPPPPKAPQKLTPLAAAHRLDDPSTIALLNALPRQSKAARRLAASLYLNKSKSPTVRQAAQAFLQPK